MRSLPPAAQGAGLWEAFRIQRQVIGALLLREMSSRFGRENLGFVWLFAEPALLGGTIGLVHHLSGHGLPGGLSIPVFWVLGYVPFYMVRSIVNRAPVAIAGNQGLLYHRRVTVLDVLLARNILEGAAVIGTMGVFMAFFGITLGVWPHDPALVVIGLVLMWGICHGISLLLASLAVYTELVERLTHLVTYLSLPLIGAFFMVFWLPPDAAEGALWIPTVHCFEIIRRGQFGHAVPTTFDIPYVLACIALLNLLGMAALRKARRDLVV